MLEPTMPSENGCAKPDEYDYVELYRDSVKDGALLQHKNEQLQAQLKRALRLLAESYDGPAGLSWRSPVPLSDAGAPEPLPLEAFPGWMRAHIESVAGFVQVPPDLPALLALSVASGALQKKAEVQARPGWTEPLTLWGAGVLESGARKSPTFKHMARPVEAYETACQDAVRDEHIRACDRRDVLEKRLHRAKKEAVKAPPDERDAAERAVQAAREELERHHVPPLPQLWIDDVTSEALLQVLSANHGRMLAMSPEGDLFKYMGGRYGTDASVLNVYKKAWTGEEATRDNRVTRDGADVSNPALAVGICVQPQVLEDLAHKRTFRGEGLLARFLYVAPRSLVGRRATGLDVPPLDRAAQSRYEQRLTALLELDPQSRSGGAWTPHTLELTAKAQEALASFEAEVEAMLQPGGRLDGLPDWGGKLVGQAVRIAGVLHVAQQMAFEEDLPACRMREGIDLAQAFISHAQTAYDLLGGNEKTRLARYLWQRIADVLGLEPDTQYPHNPQNPRAHKSSGNIGNIGEGVWLTKRDLWQAARGKSEIASVGDLDAPLRQLEEHHYIQVVDSQTRGPGRPPSPRIYVNPSLIDTPS